MKTVLFLKISTGIVMALMVGMLFSACGKVHDSSATPAQNSIAVVPTQEPIEPEPDETPVPDRFVIEKSEDHGGVSISVIHDTQTGFRYMLVAGEGNSVTRLPENH